MLEILDTAGTVSRATILSKLGGKDPILVSRTGFLAHVLYVDFLESNEQLAVSYIVIATVYFVYYYLSLLQG